MAYGKTHELWVVGYPGLFGGADTELDHNIDLWRSFEFWRGSAPGADVRPERCGDAVVRAARLKLTTDEHG